MQPKVALGWLCNLCVEWKIMCVHQRYINLIAGVKVIAKGVHVCNFTSE